jgi:hypothetical protein
MKVKYICHAVKWFDKVNGNTYYSVKVTRTRDNKSIVSCDVVYGYGDHYQQTAKEIMLKAGWIPSKYKDNVWLYERENDYPIQWNVHHGLKRDMKENVRI